MRSRVGQVFAGLLLMFLCQAAIASGPVAPQGWEGSFSAKLPSGDSCCLPADLNGSGSTGGAILLVSSDKTEFGLFALTYSPRLKEHWELLEKHPIALLKSFRFSIINPDDSSRVAIKACVQAACSFHAPPFTSHSLVSTELQHEDGWVGTVVPPYPSGVHELSGSCVGSGTSGDDLCTISIQLLRDEQSHVRTLLATRELHHPDGTRVGGDQPLQLVTDAIEPDVLFDAKVEVAVGTCQRDGTDDARIVAALVPGPDAEWFSDFRGLWRLGEDGRFAPLDPAGVRCRNEGFGYDG